MKYYVGMAMVAVLMVGIFLGHNYFSAGAKHARAWSKNINTALKELKTDSVYQERFLGVVSGADENGKAIISSESGFALFLVMVKNKPELKTPRGITNSNGHVYLATEDGGYYYVAPLEEVKAWIKAEKKRLYWS